MAQRPPVTIPAHPRLTLRLGFAGRKDLDENAQRHLRAQLKSVYDRTHRRRTHPRSRRMVRAVSEGLGGSRGEEGWMMLTNRSVEMKPMLSQRTYQPKHYPRTQSATKTQEAA